jgi:hypothetical protein
MAPGIKTGGRKKGSRNRVLRPAKYITKDIAQSLAQLDQTGGKSMAQIQIEGARYLESVARAEREKPEPQIEAATKYAAMAAKVAHDVSPYLYPALQSIKHGGDENAAPIRFENLSEHQLETLIARLRKG